MSNRFKLLVFDWDGTLMDSEARIISSFQEAIAETGLPSRTAEQIRYIIGLGLTQAVNALFPEANSRQYAQLMDAYRHYFLHVSQLPTPLFPQAAETIQQLYDAGYSLAVATGKSRVGLNRALAETGLGTLFHTTRCAEETSSKPNPQMLQEIMQELSYLPTETLMIGDSEYDLAMACNAGTASIAVTYGVHTRSHLLQYNPLVLLDNIGRLRDYLGLKY